MKSNVKGVFGKQKFDEKKMTFIKKVTFANFLLNKNELRPSTVLDDHFVTSGRRKTIHFLCNF